VGTEADRFGHAATLPKPSVRAAIERQVSPALALQESDVRDRALRGLARHIRPRSVAASGGLRVQSGRGSRSRSD